MDGLNWWILVGVFMVALLQTVLLLGGVLTIRLTLHRSLREGNTAKDAEHYSRLLRGSSRWELMLLVLSFVCLAAIYIVMIMEITSK